MRKIFTFLLALTVSVGTLFAASGTCGADGDNLTWDLTDGVLTISGTGEMADWNTDYPTWYSFRTLIKSAVIEEGVTSIGTCAFYNCSALTSITIPNSIISMGVAIFAYCEALTSVVLPDGITSIPFQTFGGCSGLTSITIPNSVTSIGQYAFDDCTGLTEITCKAIVPPYCDGDCFDGVDKSIPLYVPAGTAVYYQNENGWKEFSNIQEICVPIVGTCGAEGDNLTWALDCDGVLTISGKGAMADYESSSDIPWIDYRSDIQSLVIEEGVTSIGTGAFYGSYGLTSIAISNSVTSIGFQAFGECMGLSSVTIPNSVKSIGDYAFIVCESLISVKIGNGVTSIGESAFQQCTSLSSVTLGNSLKTIGTSAFADCSALTSIVIPNSVTSIGESVFYGCSSLTSIVIPSNVTSIGYAAFSGCSGLTSLTIGKSVTRIGMYAFENCSGLTEITCKAMTPPECSPCFDNVNKTIPLYVPAGTKEAYKGADEWKDFTNIQEELPCEPIVGTCGAEGDNLTWTLDCEGVLTISGTGAMTNWDDAFTIPWYSNRMSIQSVVIEEGVTSIGEMAFINCTALNAVTIGSGVTSIGSGAFAYCSGLTEITCKAMTPPTCASSECFLDVDKTIPLHVPAGTYTTYAAANVWKNFNIIDPYGGKCGDNLFWAYDPSTRTLTISGAGKMTNWSSSTEVPWYDNRSSIKSLEIGYSVTRIGDLAFSGCSNITAITIPASIASIGTYAIACTGLKSITCESATPPTCDDDCFYGVNKTIPLYVPAGTKEAYKGADEWKDFTNIQEELPCEPIVGTCGAEGDNLTWTLDCEGVLTISGTGAMADYSNTNPWYDNRSSIKSVVIEVGATSIGKYAFYNCDNLTSVTIPGSVKSIGNYAFNKCSSLASVTIPEGVISIGPRAFQNCTSLTSIALPEGITSIGIRTFYQCTSLKSVTIPAGVTNIYDEAFSGCNALTSITCKATTPPTCASNSFYAVTKSIPVYVPAGTKEAYQVAYVWRDFTNIQEPFDPTGFITYELVDLSTETVTAGQYLIVFDDNKAHAAVSGKDLIASSDELTFEDDYAFVPEEAVCAVTIAPLGTDSFSILLADGTSYMDQTAKNSVTTSANPSAFAITDGGEGDKTVKIAKFLPSENKTFVLKQNGTYFRMYSSTSYILPKLYRKKQKDTPTGVEDEPNSDSSLKGRGQKILRNGQILILCGEKIYTVTGHVVK